MHKNDQDRIPVYKRDILRDYALAAAELEEQFRRYQSSGAISFSILQGILGESHSKGLLWQLKDTAHYLFSDKQSTSIEGQYLDWAIGFLFHECLIILESSYQLQKYYPEAQSFLTQRREIEGQENRNELKELEANLGELAGETQQNMARMIERIRKLLLVINRLMCAYLTGEESNRPLARLIYDREELLRGVFKDLYEVLIANIFGDAPEKAVLEAALSLYDSGHAVRSERAARQALAINADCAEAAALLDKIKQMRQ